MGGAVEEAVVAVAVEGVAEAGEGEQVPEPVLAQVLMQGPTSAIPVCPLVEEGASQRSPNWICFVTGVVRRLRIQPLPKTHHWNPTPLRRNSLPP